MKEILFENKTAPFEFFRDINLIKTPHFHKEIEMVYCSSGSFYAYADRKKTFFRAGDFFISFPNQIHYYESQKDSRYLIIIFPADILFELKDTMYNFIPKNNILPQSQNSEFEQLLLSVADIKGKYGKTLIVGLLNQAAALFLPHLELAPRIKTSNTSLQEILKFCSSNFADDISLDDVADALHISKFHISHLMNDKLGLSFNGYLNNLRINSACDLLEDTDKKITDIAAEVGFGSIRSLNRAFQELMKMSPSQYRNQFKHQKTPST